MSDAFFRSVKGLSNDADQVTVLMERIKQLQQELETARKLIDHDTAAILKLQRELDAARADIENLKYCHGDACADIRRLLKQLADAKAQIADYEGSLELIGRSRALNGDDTASAQHARETLNKWRTK